MPETTNKPAWVVALDEAQAVLKTASDQDTPETTDAKTRLAYAWMAVSDRLNNDNAPTTVSTTL